MTAKEAKKKSREMRIREVLLFRLRQEVEELKKKKKCVRREKPGRLRKWA